MLPSRLVGAPGSASRRARFLSFTLSGGDVGADKQERVGDSRSCLLVFPSPETDIAVGCFVVARGEGEGVGLPDHRQINDALV